MFEPRPVISVMLFGWRSDIGNACRSRTAVAPLERLKILMQVQGNDKIYKGVWQVWHVLSHWPVYPAAATGIAGPDMQAQQQSAHLASTASNSLSRLWLA